ncbi:MAG TPA: CDGSH iron-sulfur domain-containing protein [Acidimicrobiales bacterium]|nr:CDGSH iron-sulfur domain-containing protein [Acidimicrobiales bacterium]
MADAPDVRIKVTPNGPYHVVGDAALVAKAQVETELGEPIAWEVGPELAHKERYALCRCGQSGRKPFCDGTHLRVGFEADDELRTREPTEYPGTGVTLFDDRNVCVHAGYCGTTITNVWKMVRKTDDTAVRSMLIAMVERCPSGAVTYSLDGGATDNEPRLPAEIGVMANGPLWVTGSIPVDVGESGALQARNRVALCRCGASDRKPLCDGSHKSVGFVDDPRDRD